MATRDAERCKHLLESHAITACTSVIFARSHYVYLCIPLTLFRSCPCRAAFTPQQHGTLHAAVPPQSGCQLLSIAARLVSRGRAWSGLARWGCSTRRRCQRGTRARGGQSANQGGVWESQRWAWRKSCWRTHGAIQEFVPVNHKRPPAGCSRRRGQGVRFKRRRWRSRARACRHYRGEGLWDCSSPAEDAVDGRACSRAPAVLVLARPRRSLRA